MDKTKVDSRAWVNWHAQDATLVPVIPGARFWKFQENPSPGPEIPRHTERGRARALSQRIFTELVLWLIFPQQDCAFPKADCRILLLFKCLVVDFWIRTKNLRSHCRNLLRKLSSETKLSRTKSHQMFGCSTFTFLQWRRSLQLLMWDQLATISWDL